MEIYLHSPIRLNVVVLISQEQFYLLTGNVLPLCELLWDMRVKLKTFLYFEIYWDDEAFQLVVSRKKIHGISLFCLQQREIWTREIWGRNKFGFEIVYESVLVSRFNIKFQWKRNWLYMKLGTQSF